MILNRVLRCRRTFFCEALNVRKNSASALGYRVDLGFTIGLHNKDLKLLKLIQAYFVCCAGIGNITKLGEESSQYRVTSIGDLKIIINHFYTYPLITQKRADFLLFKQAYLSVCNKEHLSLEGLNKIIGIRA